MSIAFPNTDDELRHALDLRDWLSDRARNFTLEELGCWCGLIECPMLPIDQPDFGNFVRVLQSLRHTLAFPLMVNSGYRCPKINRQIYVERAKAAGLPEPGPDEYLDGPHTKGAADIGIAFERMCLLVAEMTQRRMGLGISQKGDVAKRFIHADNLGFRIWNY